MWITRVVSQFSRVIDPVTRIINGVGVGILAVMMFFTVTDVCLRYFFNRPFASSFELTEFMMAILVAFGLAYTARLDGHIKVDILTSRLPKRIQAAISSFTNLVCVVVFILIAWQSFAQAKTLYLSGLTSEVLYIPVFPFVLMTGIGFALLGLVFLINFFVSLSQTMKKWNRSL